MSVESFYSLVESEKEGAVETTLQYFEFGLQNTFQPLAVNITYCNFNPVNPDTRNNRQKLNKSTQKVCIRVFESEEVFIRSSGFNNSHNMI